ncbi:MAG: hypothetical protein MR936_00170, partial [Eubacterium sp.]|nr:hypothetical protein [Eubacterium sp.]
KTSYFLRNQETGFVCCTILNRLYTQNQKNPADAQGDSLKQKTCVCRVPGEILPCVLDEKSVYC